MNQEQNNNEANGQAVNVDPLVICGFSIAWVGKCKTPVDAEGCRCDKHSGIKCASCGKPAMKECDETGGLVCGAPLCDECTHNTHPEGHNGMFHKWPEGMKQHCKKSEQVFSPWYVDSETLSEWKKHNGIPESASVALTCNR